MDTIIISGFPGIGKSYLFNNSSILGKELKILDSDSSKFSWLEPGVRNPDFPNNYIKHIKDNIGKVNFILVSSHAHVRQMMKENNIQYYLVYPVNKNMKELYMSRYIQRNSPEKFIKFMDEGWDDMVDSCLQDMWAYHIPLCGNQYLGDVIKAWNLLK